MFDLFRSRDKAVRYLLGALLGVVALSMVVTLIPGYGTPAAPSESIVAEVDNEPISIRQVQALMQNVIRSRRVPPEMIQHYVPQMVDQMITERAVAYQAKRMGFKVSDADVANAIRSMLPQMIGTSEFDRNLYSAYLQQQGLTVNEFEHNIRTNLLLLKLQNIALEGAIVTPAEVAMEYHRKNDQVKVDYVSWTPKDLRSKANVTPEQVQAFFNQNKTQFNTPERRSFQLLIADEAKIGAGIEVPEADLRTAYAQNQDRYRSPERIHARHILIKTTEKSPEDVKKAEAQANDLLKQIRGGADFAALASKFSDDPGSKANGGDLGFFGRGQMVPPFEQAAFALKPKEVSNVVKTDFGYHIIQLLAREDAKLKPFEEVKAELATELKREAVYNRMQNAVEQARTELLASPKSGAQIASKFGLTFADVQDFTKGMPLPELGASADVDATVSSLPAGEVSSVMQVAPTKLAIVLVTNIETPKPAAFADVQNDIRQTLINNAVAQLAQTAVRETMDKVKGMVGGGDLKAIAKAIGGEVKSTQLFTMEGSADGIGPASYLAEAFTKPVGTVIAPFNLGNQVFVAKVAEKQVADAAGLESSRDQLVVALKSRKAQERKELFEDGLVTQLIKEGKVKKNQDNIKRLVTQYQG